MRCNGSGGGGKIERFERERYAKFIDATESAIPTSSLDLNWMRCFVGIVDSDDDRYCPYGRIECQILGSINGTRIINRKTKNKN